MISKTALTRWVLLGALFAPLPALAGTLESARSAVEAHYALYRTKDAVPGVDGLSLAFGPVLRASLSRASLEGLLDADPFCNCQDHADEGFTADILSVRRLGRQVAVRLRVVPVPGAEPTRMTLMLDRHRGDWVVTDIIQPGGHSLLRAARQAAPRPALIEGAP